MPSNGAPLLLLLAQIGGIGSCGTCKSDAAWLRRNHSIHGCCFYNRGLFNDEGMRGATSR